MTDLLILTAAVDPPTNVRATILQVVPSLTWRKALPIPSLYKLLLVTTEGVVTVMK